MSKNILFIITDDQRYNTINALGCNDIKTPNLNWLVKNGTNFTSAHIPGGTSGAICMPSRAMLNTGRRLFEIENEGQNIPKEHTTMAECCKSGGYECFGTGKWHNGTPAFARGFTGGSSIFFGGMWDHWNVPVCRFDETGEYDNEINFVADFAHKNKTVSVHCDSFNPGVHSTELVTKTALEFLRHHKNDKPYFLYTSYLAPHDPRTMPDKFKNMYNPNSITLPDNFSEQHGFNFGVESIRDECLAGYPREKAEIQKHLAEYYGMISHLDEQIGFLLTHLIETDTLKNTVVVFTSDNGLSLGGHGLMGKQNLYEESIRVPLIFAGADIPRGVTSDSYVYLLDIFPTLCELMDFDIPSSVQGISFKKLFANPNSIIRDELYFAYNDILRAVKTNSHKLIEYRNTAKAVQLFDLLNDPYEINNIAPQNMELVDRLSKIMLKHKDMWECTNHRYSHGFWQL